MKSQIAFATLGAALLGAVPAAHAQTVITREIADQPVETVISPAATVVAQAPLVTVPAAQTVQTTTTETVRTVRPVPHSARRQVVTTRTVTRRVIPAPAVVAPTVAAAPVPQPLYDVAAPLATSDDYYYSTPPLYDVAAPAPVIAPAPAVPAVGVQPYVYRYVYQPDRILVIDPVTGVAVQAIPR